MWYFFEKDISRYLFFQKLLIFSVLRLPFLMTVLKTVTSFETNFYFAMEQNVRKNGDKFHKDFSSSFELQAFKYCKLTCQFATARTHFLAVSPSFLKMCINFVWLGIFCSNFTQLQHLCYIFILFRICVEIEKKTVFRYLYFQNFEFFSVLKPPFLMTVLKMVTISGFFFHLPVVKHIRIKGAKFHVVLMNSF